MRNALVALTVLIAGCGLVPNPQHTAEGVTHRQEMRGNYQRIASCAFERLEATPFAPIRKVELSDRHTVRLMQGDAFVAKWQIDFVGTSASATTIVIPIPRIMGEVHPSDLLPHVAACAG